MARSVHNTGRDRARAILTDACERDGQGDRLTERERRKAYRQAINDAIQELTPSPNASGVQRRKGARPVQPDA